MYPLKVVPFNEKTPVFELDFTHRNFLFIENTCKGINQFGDGTISNNINDLGVTRHLEQESYLGDPG